MDRLPSLPREDLIRYLEAKHKRENEIKFAIPNIDSIHVDPELVTATTLDGLCFAHWLGGARRELPALISVALSPDRLRPARWLYERPFCPEKLCRPLSVALLQTDENLAKQVGAAGRVKEVSLNLSRKLLELGIDRDPDTYGRRRNLAELSPMHARVAEALTLCLTQHFSAPNTPTANGILIPSYARGLDCANRFRGSRPRPGYSGGHGTSDTLRRAA